MRRQDDQTTAEMIAVLVAMCWVPARPTVPAKGVCDATAASVAPIPMPSAARAKRPAAGRDCAMGVGSSRPAYPSQSPTDPQGVILLYQGYARLRPRSLARTGSMDDCGCLLRHYALVAESEAKARRTAEVQPKGAVLYQTRNQR
jgi:hypothetical protein